MSNLPFRGRLRKSSVKPMKPMIMAVSDTANPATPNFQAAVISAANSSYPTSSVNGGWVSLATGGQYFPYDYNVTQQGKNVTVVDAFNLFNSRLSGDPASGPLTIIKDFYEKYSTAIADTQWQISAADQSVVTGAEQKSQSAMTTMVNEYTSLYGPITPAQYTAAAIYGVPNNDAASYIVNYQYCTIWSGSAANKVPPIPVSQAGLTSAQVPYAPITAINPLLPMVNAYIQASGPIWPIDNSQTAGNSELTSVYANIQHPDGSYQVWDPLNPAVTTAEPGYSTAPPWQVLVNDLGLTAQPSGALTVVASVSESAQTVNVQFGQQSGFGCSSSNFFFMTGGASSTQYSIFSVAGSGSKATVTATFPNPTPVTINPATYQTANTTVGWYDSSVVEQANGNNNGATGFAFGNTKPQLNLQKNGDYGRLSSILVSQMPTIEIYYSEGNMSQFNETVTQKSSWVTTFCGIPISHGSSTKSSAITKENSQSGGFTLTLTPPDQGGLPLYELYAYILGGTVVWPGVQSG